MYKVNSRYRLKQAKDKGLDKENHKPEDLKSDVSQEKSISFLDKDFKAGRCLWMLSK